MTLPRPVFPRVTNMMMRDCTARQFLLRPDRETNNAFLYCIGVAAEVAEVQLLNFVQMSNHLHDAIYDPLGKTPDFNQHFHKLLAKCVNALRGRWDHVFSGAQVSVVRLETREALIDKLVYISTNPVKDGLVASVDEWPGAIGHRALVTGKPIVATRPKHFFAEDGTMPREVTLHLRIPPELGDHDEIVAEVKARVEAVEQEHARLRAQTGQRPLGRNAVLRQSWRESPTSRLPRRGLRPTVAARNLWALLEALQRNGEFVAKYRAAREALLAGTPIPFPAGTYWLRHFLGVEVEDFEKLN